jgi:hypothetical protein
LPADDLARWCIGETEEKLSFGALRGSAFDTAPPTSDAIFSQEPKVRIRLPPAVSQSELCIGNWGLAKFARRLE